MDTPQKGDIWEVQGRTYHILEADSSVDLVTLLERGSLKPFSTSLHQIQRIGRRVPGISTNSKPGLPIGFGHIPPASPPPPPPPTYGMSILETLQRMGSTSSLGKTNNCHQHKWIDTGMKRTYCKECNAVGEVDVMAGVVRAVG